MNEKRIEELAWMCDTKERAIAALETCAREAAEEERERCAKLCEGQRFGIDGFGSIDYHVEMARDQCAAAIRGTP